MTLSSDEVISYLNKHCVSARKNIKGKTHYAGTSNTHLPEYAAKWVNNLSGHHNIQMFFLTSDGRVLHCLPGYWSVKDFLHEARFAAKLGKIYYNKSLTTSKRNENFLDLHLAHAYEHDVNLQHSSRLQGFDKSHVAKKTKDFSRKDGFVYGLKTPDQVIHERLAEQPFVPYASFDVAKFVNLGIKRYKYDYGVPGKGKYSSKKKGYRYGKKHPTTKNKYDKRAKRAKNEKYSKAKKYSK